MFTPSRKIEVKTKLTVQRGIGIFYLAEDETREICVTTKQHKETIKIQNETSLKDLKNKFIKHWNDIPTNELLFLDSESFETLNNETLIKDLTCLNLFLIRCNNEKENLSRIKKLENDTVELTNSVKKLQQESHNRNMEYSMYEKSRLKQKLQQERMSAPLKLIDFTLDSTMFRNNITNVQNKLASLGKQLKILVKTGDEFGKTAILFSEKLCDVGRELQRSFTYFEDGTEVLSLTKQTDIVGMLLDDLGNQILTLNSTLKVALFDRCSDFVNKELKNINEQEKDLNKAKQEFEKSLSKVLRFDTEQTTGSMFKKKLDEAINEKTFNQLVDRKK
eukprot:UN06933